MNATIISCKPSNTRAMIIFAGWSTYPDFYADLRCKGWDIFVVNGYSDLSFDATPFLGYSTIYVIAWSLGVAAAEYAAAHSALGNGVTAAFAINGTPFPVSDTYGIPENIYYATEASLTPDNLRRFRRRMSSPRDPYQLPDINPGGDDIPLLRSELRQIAALPHSETHLPWRRAYIGTNDRIFSAESQRRAWNNLPVSPQIIEITAGHYIPLPMILAEVTPDYDRIGRRFSRAVATYDSNAVAQSGIALHLADLLTESLRFSDAPIPISSLLEIGPGSGQLTYLLGQRLKPERADFIDLYKLPEFSIARKENYFTEDAEEWMEVNKDNRKFDLIASASTIQWFINPERFFRNAASMLNPGGFLLLSTFLPGNLKELDELRPSPLLYHSGKRLLEMLEPYFIIERSEDEEITLKFNSPRELLLHLKLTGVGGGSNALGANLLTHLPARPTLTYHPLYILARRR